MNKSVFKAQTFILFASFFQVFWFFAFSILQVVNHKTLLSDLITSSQTIFKVLYSFYVISGPFLLMSSLGYVIYERHKGGWVSVKVMPLDKIENDQDILLPLQREIIQNEFDSELLFMHGNHNALLKAD